VALSVFLAHEIFDFFANEGLTYHNGDLFLLPTLGLWAVVGTFDKQAQFTADTVESALWGCRVKKAV
jgi:hypothetical protein